ncbi:MAG: aminotransferase class I/II-fold pyridoxal phosphate-dependent enzyme [Daejeonella sp.]|uniref:aminotransferase class I/II-fold pyridoxal phosphate-dependent enzyme n=1 Tax=Daejeonella sp. TaxID=2805397 RepID=UPI0027375BDB|nr:aminotransferase class I/II-fold pyridoxal phosphate-dependent enzyme [Daejeonella sp.]MDP3467145.1 aminotransferase class I/II-fold pyridoxal phosphate-dependent enzyme [Daejeonella sp.]
MKKGTGLNLFFGGTAYLGMPHNEAFKKLVFEGIEIYGINYGASRNNNITLDIFSIAENEAASRFGAEDSIFLSSGYLAAQLLVQQYYETHLLIYAPDTHPALWIGKPAAPRIKFEEWAENTVKQINESDQPVMLISNSLNNLIPEIYNFDWLNCIDPLKKIVLLIDDSHGIGITGNQGEGIYSSLPQLPNIETFVIASMAKALGFDAGMILGNTEGIMNLRNSPVYVGSSPPSPGMLYAFVHAESIYKHELNNLHRNLRLFTDLLESTKKLFFINDFPVFLLLDDEIAINLLKNGINISSFPYPDPNAKAIHRIVITSIHEIEELEILAKAIDRNY